MSLVTQINGLITAIGTDWKNIWAKIGVGALNTTAQNLVAAINEVKSTADNATIPDSSTTVKGKVELSTDAEAIAADSTRAVTGSNLAAYFANRIDTNTALGASNTLIPSQAAVKAYADGLLDANNAWQMKGGIDCSANPNYPAASAGHTYRVTVAGKIGGASGTNVEINDTLACLVDSTVAGTQAAVGANWLITQTNIDGAVVGPASSVATDFASFGGVTGKVIQDSGVSLDTDVTLAANADTKVPSQKAVKTYTYSQTQLGDPTTDFVQAYTAAKV